MGINPTPRLTRSLAERGVFRAQPCFVVDVGASGGIQEHWREFGDALCGVGFDPLIHEIDRLNETEPNSEVRYVATRVGYRDMPDLECGLFNTDPHFRTSQVKAQLQSSQAECARLRDSIAGSWALKLARAMPLAVPIRRLFGTGSNAPAPNR